LFLAWRLQNFNFLGSGAARSLQIAQSLEGSVLTCYKHLARQLGVWLSLGGLQETAEPQAAADGNGSSSSSSSAEQILNCHIVINSSGEVAAVYRKAHLFDAPYVGLKESAFTRAGDALAGSLLTF
jgi:deaminated glutathione amidase